MQEHYTMRLKRRSRKKLQTSVLINFNMLTNEVLVPKVVFVIQNTANIDKVQFKFILIGNYWVIKY
jgi:hypothetical protein